MGGAAGPRPHETCQRSHPVVSAAESLPPDGAPRSPPREIHGRPAPGVCTTGANETYQGRRQPDPLDAGNPAQIRRFIVFSEGEARAAGLEPQQHQLLLAVKGLPERRRPTIRVLAARLQLRHRSVVELVDRPVADLAPIDVAAPARGPLVRDSSAPRARSWSRRCARSSPGSPDDEDAAAAGRAGRCHRHQPAVDQRTRFPVAGAGRSSCCRSALRMTSQHCRRHGTACELVTLRYAQVIRPLGMLGGMHLLRQ